MAVIHRATIAPTKAEVLERRLGSPVTVLGAYRFDDPEGQVGVEGFLLDAGGTVLHAVLTYRNAPLAGADAHLICTMEHSVLGTRWVYDGLGDPVALGCYDRALRGDQAQATEEVWDGAERIQTREPTVRVTLVLPDGHDQEAGVPVIATDPRESDGSRAHLLARWSGGTAIVAARGH
ncbi:hypothetical protein P5P86_12080 [Nocardioides sp. BP30]|uniref:maltokinase N-terminal cap-like domain-containing protein n=1 Tax=Nocardioides sp. BP30 TaxID=3036374 RepID=UPI002468DD55|nr:hypothetical protein [Nocardioides sp. BP30]WGL50701.1 hypothetical protein P5P86_12080 [Nocardioides sp. BP30]